MVGSRVDAPASELICIQARVFEAVAGNGALMGTPRELARRFGARPRDLLAGLDGLVRAGWIRAEPGPGVSAHPPTVHGRRPRLPLNGGSRPNTMLPPEASRAANELRALAHDEALPALGLVDVGEGARLTFRLAVEATLGDLARFSAWAHAGHHIEPRRWRQVGADLLHLHRLVAGHANPGRA